jgi:Leucine-rich repeat (LRR) protein
LNQNNLKTIPSSIGTMKKLFKIRLEFNFITELPAEIGECESLAFIYLERNNLTKLPEELGKLNKLKEIYLANAGVLIDVPETFCYLRFLEILEIDSTTAIPPCLLVYHANRLKIIQK